MMKYTVDHDLNDYFISRTTIINLEIYSAGVIVSINRASPNIDSPIIKWTCSSSLGLDLICS